MDEKWRCRILSCLWEPSYEDDSGKVEYNREKQYRPVRCHFRGTVGAFPRWKRWRCCALRFVSKVFFWLDSRSQAHFHGLWASYCDTEAAWRESLHRKRRESLGHSHSDWLSDVCIIKWAGKWYDFEEVLTNHCAVARNGEVPMHIDYLQKAAYLWCIGEEPVARRSLEPSRRWCECGCSWRVQPQAFIRWIIFFS